MVQKYAPWHISTADRCRSDNINATTLTAIPSKEYRVNPHTESTHEVYASDGKQVLMSKEAYELYKHQLDLNSKMHRRIHDMEFNEKMKSFGCIELLVRFLDGTQIMGNVKIYLMQWRGLNVWKIVYFMCNILIVKLLCLYISTIFRIFALS